MTTMNSTFLLIETHSQSEILVKVVPGQVDRL